MPKRKISISERIEDIKNRNNHGSKFKCYVCHQWHDNVELSNTYPICVACEVWKSFYYPRRHKSENNIGMLDFVRFFGSHLDRKCSYCNLYETDLRKLDIAGFSGLSLTRMGVDRIDSRLPYLKSNLAICCFTCNRIKSNIFSVSEMKNILGPAVRECYEERAKEIGIRLR